MGAIPSNERKSVDQVVIDLGVSSDSRRLADEYVTTRKSYRLTTGANELVITVCYEFLRF